MKKILAFILCIILVLPFVTSCKGDEPQTQEPVTQTTPVTGETGTEENLTTETQTQEPQTQEPQTSEPATQEPQTQEPETQGSTDGSTDGGSTGGGSTGGGSTGGGSTGGGSTNSHTHSYSNATCTAPAKCSCGATKGSALGHKFSAATCTAPKKCSTCGATEGSALGHKYSSYKCTVCGAADPSAPKFPTVAEPLTWEKLNAIPIANSNMSEDELRKIVIDFFRLTLSFSWTPNSTIEYVISSQDRPVSLPSGIVYGGLPYVTGASGNLYKMMNYYDPATGVLDTASLGTGEKFQNVMGTQCSFSTTWAWARVSNHVKNFRTTAHMTQANGCYRVGEYTYDDSITQFSSKASDANSTAAIINAIGKQVMYRSFAQVKPGDGHVTSTGTHVRMFSSAATVVYNPDGTINGAKSTVRYMDQPKNWKKTTQSNGDPMLTQGNLDLVATFDDLLAGNYIPFTIPELCGKDDIEKATLSFTVTKSAATYDELSNAKLTSNEDYPISNLTITIKDSNGKILNSYDPCVFTRNTTNYLMMGKVIFPLEVIPYADGKNTIHIDCRVSTGEVINVYSGTLLG